MNKEVQAIRAEIDQLLEGEAPAHDQQCKFSDGYFTGLSAALNIIDDLIDSLPEKQPSKDLETEIATWIPAHVKGNVDEDIIDAVKRWGENVARHFVEWQAKQGYSLEYEIRYACGVSDTSTESKKATLSFPLPADIFDGDRVIIQIRKKDEQ